MSQKKQLSRQINSFGELLNYYMAKAGFTGESLAEVLGLSEKSISLYRNNHLHPDADTIIEIGMILSIHPLETLELLEYANISIRMPIRKNQLILNELYAKYYRTHNENRG